jgi:hypothetical protein
MENRRVDGFSIGHVSRQHRIALSTGSHRGIINNGKAWEKAR